MNHSEISSFIWGTADLLRSSFKQHEYGDIILPFTVMRRLDAVRKLVANAREQGQGRATLFSIRLAAANRTQSRGWHIICSRCTMKQTTQCLTR